MNGTTDSFGAIQQSGADAAKAHSNKIFPSMYLPKAVYEALPAAYMSVGAMFIAGATYIGIDHGLTVGYLAVGFTCVFAGLTVSSIRRSERSK